jgi:hypothetical protein
LASSLVERKMALLLGYCYETSQLLATYPPEPVLAFVAHKLFHKHASSIIDDYARRCNDFGDMGDIGELAARMIVLLALDNVTLLRPSCTVRSFLENLIGRDNMHDLEKWPGDSSRSRTIIDGFICLSHFVKFPEILGDVVENLGMLIILNAGLISPTNYDGIDFVIPVILKDGRLGCINFQVKSYASKLYPCHLKPIKGALLSTQFSKNIPCLNVIMNVSPCLHYSCVVDHVCPFESNVSTIIMQGLLGPFPLLDKYGARDTMEHLVKMGRFEIDNQYQPIRLPFTLQPDLFFGTLFG